MDVQAVASQKIWNRAPHNALTDLIRFRDRWFCAFREGQTHHSRDGSLRILCSADGNEWRSTALISLSAADLRDPKLTVTPDGRLMLLAGAAYHEQAPARYQSLVWFSADGADWGEPLAVGEPNFWLWRVTWHKGQCYGVAYATDDSGLVRLYRSNDGARFETLVAELYSQGAPSETALVFLPDDTCYCLLRRDADSRTAQLGTAQAPYTAWTWQDLGQHLGGPHLIRLPDGRLVAAGRLFDDRGRERTSLLWLDPARGTLTEFATFPSGGDSSYPGLAWHDGLLWVSYYSSHEGKTAVYLAKVALP